MELADATQDIDGAIALDMLWPAIAATHEILSYCDSTRGEDRFAIFDGARLKGALFISRSPVACARTFITDQIGAVFDDSQQRHLLLAGRAGAGTRDKGPTVCACFEVGRIEIVEAIESGRAATVDAVGQATRAGTNCGACRAEIGGLIRVAARPRPTEVMHR